MQLTKSQFQVVPPAVFGSDVSTTARRLAVIRGPGANAISKHIESFLFSKIEAHFPSPSCVFRFNRPYRTGKDKGDIDIIAYEPQRKILTLAQVKTFIPPDTVPEVCRANKDIEEAVSQIIRVRDWVNVTPPNTRAQILGISALDPNARIVYAVIGHGFVGGGNIQMPGFITRADLEFILRPEFKGMSFEKSLIAYSAKLDQMKSRAKTETKTINFYLAGVRLRMPALVRYIH